MRRLFGILLVAIMLWSNAAWCQVDTARVRAAIDSLHRLEFGADTLNNTDLSNDLVSKQIILFDSIKDNSGLANCYYRLAVNCSNTLKQSQSLSYMQRSMEYCQEVGDSSLLCDIYFTLASTYAERQIYDIALDYFDKSMDIAVSKSDTTRLIRTKFTRALIQGELFGTKNDTTALLDALAKCEELYPILKDDPGLIKQFMNFCINVPNMYMDALQFSDDERSARFLSKADEIFSAGQPLCSLHPMVPIAMFQTKIRLMCLHGRFAEARRELMKFSRASEYENYIFLTAACCYYKSVKDYPNYLKYNSELRKVNHRDFSAQCYAEYEQNQSKAEFEVQMEQHDKDAAQRDLLFEQATNRAKLFNTYMLWIMGIALLIVVIVVSQFLSSSKINKTLKKTNEDIMFRNKTLEQLQKQILKQNEEIQSQNDLIIEQRNSLKKTNDNLVGSLNYAYRIQRAAVPSDTMMDSLFPNRVLYWMPKNIVSGDFYWATQDSRRKYLITADCTGHGVPGALLSMLGMSIINDVFAHVTADNTAAEILDQVKDKFADSWSKGGGNIEDGMDLAFFIIDKADNKLQYAGAKRPMYMVRDNVVSVTKPDKLCVGYNIRKETAKFTNHVVDTKPGDMFFAFSDGIPDQFGGTDGKTKFGQKMLEDFLSNIADLPIYVQQSAVTASIKAWMTYNGNTVSQLDDQLLIGIKI